MSNEGTEKEGSRSPTATAAALITGVFAVVAIVVTHYFPDPKKEDSDKTQSSQVIAGQINGPVAPGGFALQTTGPTTNNNYYQQDKSNGKDRASGSSAGNAKQRPSAASPSPLSAEKLQLYAEGLLAKGTASGDSSNPHAERVNEATAPSGPIDYRPGTTPDGANQNAANVPYVARHHTPPTQQNGYVGNGIATVVVAGAKAPIQGQRGRQVLGPGANARNVDLPNGCSGSWLVPGQMEPQADRSQRCLYQLHLVGQSIPKANCMNMGANDQFQASWSGQLADTRDLSTKLNKIDASGASVSVDLSTYDDSGGCQPLALNWSLQ